MQTNVGNYAAVDELPSFRLFTWFFVIPGILVLALGLLTVRGERSQREPAAAPALA